MPGYATEAAPIVADGASVLVSVPGQGKPVRLIDARPKLQWSEAEIEQAVEEQQKKAGALVALVRAETEAAWADIRRELNEAAGGTASRRVMVLAHHALRAHQALELQTLLAEVAAGRPEGSKGLDPNNGLRNQSGLSVIATQALNSAFEAARAEAKLNQGSPTEQLMTRLGVGGPRQNISEVPGSSPFDPGGVVASGSPLPSIPAPTGESA